MRDWPLKTDEHQDNKDDQRTPYFHAKSDKACEVNIAQLGFGKFNAFNTSLWVAQEDVLAEMGKLPDTDSEEHRVK